MQENEKQEIIVGEEVTPPEDATDGGKRLYAEMSRIAPERFREHVLGFISVRLRSHIDVMQKELDNKVGTEEDWQFYREEIEATSKVIAALEKYE